ncbi:MAG: PAS domain S-box protein, partial [Bacteroidetes bacterium]|nr:PAS domain S-box protein [Bacteroidota bacterium]
MKKTFIFFFTVVSLATANLTAQSFTTYSVEHGLAQSQVYAMCQDRNGYLWFGTYGGGVSRFDGVHFQTYTVHDGLVNNAVYSIHEDRTGRLWFGTDNGLCSYNGVDFTTYSEFDSAVVNVIYESKDGKLWFGIDQALVMYDGSRFTRFNNAMEYFSVSAIAQGPQGKLWIGTEGAGLFTFEDSAFTSVALPALLPKKIIYSLLFVRNGDLWIGTSQAGAIKLKTDGSVETLTTKKGLASNTVWHIIEDRQGRLWFGTHDGLNLLSKDTMLTFTDKDGMSSNNVWSLMEDLEGNVWVGTDIGGVMRYRDFGIESFTKSQGLHSGDVWSIVEDDRGSVWFGTSGGLVRMKAGRFDYFKLTVRGQSAIIYCVFQDSRKRLWVGTDGLGAFRFDGESFHHVTGPSHLANATVYSVYEDRKHALWFATGEAGLCRMDDSGWTCFTTKDGLTDNSAFSILEDLSGNFWCLTYRGVSRLRGNHFESAFGKGKLDKFVTLSITQDSSGGIWFGTENGIFLFENDSLLHFTEADGLTSNIVYFVGVDHLDHLWIGHNRGVDKFELGAYRATGQKHFRNFGTEEGLYGLECNQNAVTCDSRGRMWFGTVNGAYRFTPRMADQPMPEPIPHIRGLRLFMQKTNSRKYAERIDPRSQLPVHLSLPYNQNHLTFDYTAISFTAPSKLRFRFRLNGFDEEWSPVTGERSAVYSNLPPGSYEFEVLAKNGDGAWSSAPSMLSFVIRPPFWRTWWFQLFAVVFVGSLIVGFVRMRTARIRQRASELMVFNEALQKQIQERERAEEAVRTSEGKFRTLAELLTASIFVVRGEQIIYTNPYASEYTGYTTDELSRMKFWEFTHPEQRDMVKRLGRFRQSGQAAPSRYELKIVTKSGEERWCEMLMNLVEYDGERSILGAAIDITERKHAVEALFQSEAKYKNLFTNSLVGMFKTSFGTGTVIEANRRAREILGFDMGKVRTSDLYVDPDDREVMKRKLLEEGFVENFETRMRRMDGEIIWVSYSARYFKEDGCLEGVIIDITQRKRTEDELAKVRKIESLGILAGGIAHDFN